MYYTKDIYLDAVTEDGLQELYKLYNDYDLLAGIGSTYDFVVPRRYESLKKQTADGGACFLVRQRSDKAVVGYGELSTNWITHVSCPMLFIGKDYRGKGYGKQLIALLMYFAFEEVNVRKMAITVYDFNKRARYLYDLVGFKEEGRVKEECYRNGKYWDVIYLGLFRKDYRQYWLTQVSTEGGGSIDT